MSNRFSDLIEVIVQAIRTNNNEEITGAILQGVLLEMVEDLGDEAIVALEAAVTALQTASNATNARMGYYTCSTESATAEKEITATNYSLPTNGGCVKIKFTHKNTADNATLNINSTGAKPLYYAGARAGEGNSWKDNETVVVFYDGTNYIANNVTNLSNALQAAVNAINANIGNGYVYAGIATPSGTPVSGKVFYLARQAGTYTNFGGLTLTEGVNVLKYNGTAWSQEQLISIADIYKNPLMGYYECDTAGGTAAKTVAATGYVLPATGGSVKIKMANRNTATDATLNINSTGAKPLYYNGTRAGVGNTWDTNEIIEVFYDGTNYQSFNVAGSKGGGVFDISAWNLTNGQPSTYEDLEAALGTNGEHVPAQFREPGMQVKFIQGSVPSSDNKYVQYRLMAQTFTTDVTQWQGVDDKTINSSNNLITSGAVDKINRQVNGESEFPFNYVGSAGVPKGRFVVPFEGKSGDTITLALQDGVTGSFYVYPVGSDTSYAVTSTHTLTSDIDRVTFYISGTPGDTSTHSNVLSLTTNGALVHQINQVKEDLTTKVNISDFDSAITGKFDFPFSYKVSSGVPKGTYIVPLKGRVGDTITFALQNATLGAFYVYPVNSDESFAINSPHTLSVEIDRATFYISGISGDTSVNTAVLSLTTNDALDPRLEQVENVLPNKVNNEDVEDILIDTSATYNIVNATGLNRTWVDGYYDHRMIAPSQTLKLCLDFIEVYANREYVANTACRIICYNKSKGYCSQIDVTANIAFTIPNNVYYIRVCSTNALNLNIHLVNDAKVPKNSEDTVVTEEYFKQDNKNVLKLTPDFKNGKFRLFTKFTLDENVNTTNGEEKTIVKFKNSNKEVSFFIHKEKAIPFTETVTLRGVSLNLSYPLPRFKSHFGYTNGTNTRNYEDRTFPIFNPICGDWLFYVRYTGNNMEYSTLKMSVTDLSITIIDVGIFALGDTTTVQDIVTTLNNANEYIEAVANPQYVDVLVKKNLVNCADIPLITNSLVNNQDYSEGTFNDAYPAYVFGKIDDNIHTFEIASDGINCYAVFDGQNDGQSRLINVDNYLSADIIPMLAEGCDVYIGGSETRVEISNTVEYVRLDLNTTSDAEIERNHRIVSNHNPLLVGLIGHEMWDGKELDGITPTRELLPDYWKNKVNDPSLASSTERIKKIFKVAKEKGFDFINPINLLDNSGSKRKMYLCFDDYEVRNFYNPRLRKAFADSNAVATLAIQYMGRNITDDAEQNKINNLYINGWSPIIHGYNADRICQMTYNQLYTDDSEVSYSLAQNLKMALQYNIIERAWAYASGAQNYNGIMAFKQKGIDIGIMGNPGSQYYICKASCPLYLKRQNASDKDTFQSIVEDSFIDSDLSQIVINSSSVGGNELTVVFEEKNKAGNIETIERGICYRTSVGGVPTLKNKVVLATRPSPNNVREDTAVVTLTSGIYNVRAWARNAKGISYSDIITVEVS